KLRVFPMSCIVKIGDTLPDIAEGLNAGMWTIGLAKTGNEMGLNEREIARLTPIEYDHSLKRASERLTNTGAHYVVDGFADFTRARSSSRVCSESGCFGASLPVRRDAASFAVSHATCTCRANAN